SSRPPRRRSPTPAAGCCTPGVTVRRSSPRSAATDCPGSTRATSASWGAAPAIPDAGRRLWYARGDGEAILATIRGDGLPRIHPVNIGLVDGRLYTFVIGSSAKRIGLEREGRSGV